MSKKAEQYVRFQVPLFEGLKALADALNEIPRLNAEQAQGDLPEQETSRLVALRTIEDIVRCFSVSAPSMVPGHYTCKVQKPSQKALPERLDEGIRLFNDAAEKAPVTLSLAIRRDKWNYWSIEPGVCAETALSQYLFDVQRWVVWWGGRERLKRCGFCFKWFVDRGRNKKATWCSVSCAGRYWTRPRRQGRPVKVEVQTFDGDGRIVPKVFYTSVARPQPRTKRGTKVKGSRKQEKF